MLVSELDADKNPVRGYVLGNEYISQVNGTTFGYYLNDEQGSVRYLTGSDGSIRNHYCYGAFGETITAEKTVPNRLRYNGQMADGLTGLYYLRARYYNASLGRFTQEDVIYNDGLNLYAYCNSNPVMYSDPSGFASVPGDYDFVGPITEKDLKKYYQSIRAYQEEAIISLIPYEYRATIGSVVEMEFKGQLAGGTNAAGWERNSTKYFRRLRKTHPEYFSASNLANINSGLSPIVDEQFVKYFPQYADYMDDVLIHHHVGGGGQVIAVPRSLHPGYGGIHNYENIAGVRDNDYLTPVGQTIEDGSTNKKKGKCNKK